MRVSPTNRAKVKKRTTTAGTPGEVCRSLMVVDGKALRDQARTEYEKARRQIEEVRRKIVRFEEEDKPQFTRWLFGSFGVVLTEIRELEQRIASLESTLREIHMAMLTGVSMHRAFQRVMSRQDRRERLRKEEEQDSSDRAFEGGAQDFGGHGQEGANEREEKPRRVPGDDTKLRRVKELYRKLVRLLHPDRQLEMTAQKREWWHQVQEAYQREDSEQLEMLLALCEMESPAGPAQASISALVRMTAYLKASLRDLRKTLRRCRQDPAWEFSRQDSSMLRSQIRRHMEHEVAIRRAAVEEMERELAMMRQVSVTQAARSPSRDPWGRRRGRGVSSL